MISYFLVFVCVTFLFSKDKNVSHPFVKSHVKAATLLHILLLGVLFVMSYNFFPGVRILWYSIETLLTATACLFIFTGILYGAFMAFRGRTVTLWEIFHSVWVSHKLMQSSKSENISEENASLLIMWHIPFVWYILYGKHKNIPHMRDIVMINFLVVFLALLLFTTGFSSLASILMLMYTIYSVYQGMMLVSHGNISTPNLEYIPGVEEKYILQKSSLKYMWNTLKKNAFIPFWEIKKSITKKRYEEEKTNLEKLSQLPKSIFPSYIYYIPLVNSISLLNSHSREDFHRRNGIILTLFFIIAGWILFKNSQFLLFFLFPICYGIWYSERKAYKMPYIYDIYEILAYTGKILGNIFHVTRKLQKTHTKQSVKIWEKTTKFKEETTES